MDQMESIPLPTPLPTPAGFHCLCLKPYLTRFKSNPRASLVTITSSVSRCSRVYRRAGLDQRVTLCFSSWLSVYLVSLGLALPVMSPGCICSGATGAQTCDTGPSQPGSLRLCLQMPVAQARRQLLAVTRGGPVCEPGPLLPAWSYAFPPESGPRSLPHGHHSAGLPLAHAGPSRVTPPE